MKKIDVELLGMLNDDDIKIIVAEIKLDMMLVPFKQNSKTYAKYISRLGRLDSRSKMAQTYLPGIVYDLYNKGDLNIRKMLSNQAQILKSIIVEILAEYEKEKLTPESFSDMDSTKCVAILSEIENKEASNRIDINLFFLQLKLNAVDISEQQKEEIEKLWNEKKEKEAALKVVEDFYKREIAALKIDYEKKLSVAEHTISDLKVKIKKQEASFEDLTGKVEGQKEDSLQKENEIKELLDKLEFMAIQLEEKKKELSDTGKELSNFKEKIENQRLEFQLAWQKEIEADNEELIRKREQLNNENEFIQAEIDFLIEDRGKAEKELKQIKESLSEAEEKLSILKNDIDNFTSEHENISAGVSQIRVSVQSIGYGLYIESGMDVINKEVYGKYSQYVTAVENNLDNIGCKMYSGRLEDFFNAAIGIGLVPLLYGFGARKAARALIAARYGEIPTIISIPVGYNDASALSREIDEVKTMVVVIEDLFGRMNEEIILPILRRDVDKQLVFCVESYECLRYVDSYFMNYVQLIKVDIASHKKMEPLIYADAKEVFADCRFSEKSDMHKKVKRLLKEIEVSDIYVRSRGDMLTYLKEVIPHDIDAIFEEWFEHELWKILKPEQKKIIKERISKDSLGLSEELIERLDE